MDWLEFIILIMILWYLLGVLIVIAEDRDERRVLICL